ncbi:uncharacterized protein SOCEGT47_045940 [Sorangium cellulosum]|uniref:Uncharacterized protein n=1 Tax=Sorangium cellulosum TaxID=56 RepID=A0A4P2Q4G5_SORCE|nr:uncharacterized protein SOCEGT47_045940 [Sorangium cellulosum]
MPGPRCGRPNVPAVAGRRVGAGRPGRGALGWVPRWLHGFLRRPPCGSGRVRRGTPAVHRSPALFRRPLRCPAPRGCRACRRGCARDVQRFRLPPAYRSDLAAHRDPSGSTRGHSLTPDRASSGVSSVRATTPFLDPLDLRVDAPLVVKGDGSPGHERGGVTDRGWGDQAAAGGSTWLSSSCRCLRLTELPAGAVSWGLAAGCTGAQRAGGGAQRAARAYSLLVDGGVAAAEGDDDVGLERDVELGGEVAQRQGHLLVLGGGRGVAAWVVVGWTGRQCNRRRRWRRHRHQRHHGRQRQRRGWQRRHRRDERQQQQRQRGIRRAKRRRRRLLRGRGRILPLPDDAGCPECALMAPPPWRARHPAAPPAHPGAAGATTAANDPMRTPDGVPDGPERSASMGACSP